MLKHAFRICVGVLLVLALAHAKKSPQYITDSKDFSSIGIDRHDIESVVEKVSTKLLESSFVRELQGQKILAIADLHNLTQEDIDVEFLSRKITRTLRKSKKFTLTNAIAGSGSSTDSLITDSRKLTKDKRFNQYTTQEDGTLLAPNYSLSGKIIERRKSVGDKVRVDYDFLFVLTDLKSGRVVWDDEENIAKAIDKSQVARFSKLGAGTCEGGDAIACEREAQAALDSSDYESAQELFKQACDLGNRQACENAAYIKRALKEQKKQEKKAKAQARDGRFGLSVGADIGFGGGSANMAPTPYSSKPTTSSGSSSGKGFIHYTDGEYSKDISSVYMLKAGLWYRQKNGIYLSADVLYGGFQAKTYDSPYQFTCTGNSYGYCSWEGVDITGLKFDHKLFGGGARVGYAISSSDNSLALVGFVGGGALKDVGSSMKSVGGYVINQKLDNLFPFWEIGLMLSFKYVSLETSYRHLLNGKDDKSWASIGAFNVGVGFLLPVW
ncbi:penicillin-binding protein activator LpoB [Helicobacter sp. XJK30-2]|uniref:Penicillin-binding protein activator LpoB n=1 Tax=Helicobacter zhangjianzhongii TaxID=2974574 RepID=A0ACC6FU89_9HELI|nr:penicillin-binding protein activator LpoB [Helicobacter sp. XJK30-2]MDL0082768.1 penicillin-binding protein activator LpoB [Helicobacter sp. XJK30-2]